MLFRKKKEEAKVAELCACVSGHVIPIEEVEDEVFASKTMGNGVGIWPKNGVITAPCDGIISMTAADSRHAVGLTLNNGAELLIHEGLDTVSMNGEGFQLFVKEGEAVKAGDRLLAFDADLIMQKGLKAVCVLLVTNSDDFPNLKFYSDLDAIQGETVVAEF